MADVRIVELRTLAEREQAFAIRRAVFVQEQGVAEALEFDEHDAQARHLLALRDGEPVGTLRVRWPDRARTAKIERVAVLPAAVGLTGEAWRDPVRFAQGFVPAMWLCGGACAAGGILAALTIRNAPSAPAPRGLACSLDAPPLQTG